MQIKSIIKNFPHEIKQPVRYLYGAVPPRMRLGRTFWKTYHFLKESQWWSEEKLKVYQMEQLEKLLRHAYDHVPHYRKTFDERGLKPSDIQDLEDLCKLPFLTKPDVRKSLTSLIADNIPKSKLDYAITGGSTGIPLAFYQEKKTTEQKEWAFIINQWERVNYKFGSNFAEFKGNIIHKNHNDKYWSYDPVSKKLMFCVYNMTDDNLRKYIEKIKEYRPDFIFGKPANITILANYMLENHLQPIKCIKAVLCGSESVYKWQRQLLEKAFQCRVFSWYGQSEKVVLAGECENSNLYHIFPQYGITEIIDHKGNKITEAGKEGEIAATGFLNYAVPFIRYRTGDVGAIIPDKCSCGRHYPLFNKVEGRLQEYIVRKDMKLISLNAAFFSINESFLLSLKGIQFVQEKPGYLNIRIVKNNLISKDEIRKKFTNAFELRFGDSITFNVDFVDNIAKTKRGKTNYLIQKLPIDFHTSQLKK